MMKCKGYVARVEFDDEAGVFHGEVLNMRDVVTFEGKTVRELRRAFRESVEDCLSFCAERNEPPRKSMTEGELTGSPEIFFLQRGRVLL